MFESKAATLDRRLDASGLYNRGFNPLYSGPITISCLGKNQPYDQILVVALQIRSNCRVGVPVSAGPLTRQEQQKHQIQRLRGDGLANMKSATFMQPGPLGYCCWSFKILLCPQVASRPQRGRPTVRGVVLGGALHCMLNQQGTTQPQPNQPKT